MLSDYVFEPKSVIDLIRKIDRHETLEKSLGTVSLPSDVVGPSGQKFRTLISALNNRQTTDLAYLEIGIFKGRTLLTSAAENPEVRHIGVDNFSQFDPDGINKSIIDSAIDTCSISNVELYEQDFMQFLLDQGKYPKRNVGVYFYDAIHDYRSQFLALLHGSKLVAPGGIILVDDTNYGHVRYSTYDFIETNPDYKLLFETFTSSHPAEMTPEVAADARANWWNGTQVLIYDPAHKITGLGAIRDPQVQVRFDRSVTLSPAKWDNLETRWAVES